jgi:hypothetical protein
MNLEAPKTELSQSLIHQNKGSNADGGILSRYLWSWPRGLNVYVASKAAVKTFFKVRFRKIVCAGGLCVIEADPESNASNSLSDGTRKGLCQMLLAGHIGLIVAYIVSKGYTIFPKRTLSAVPLSTTSEFFKEHQGQLIITLLRWPII